MALCPVGFYQKCIVTQTQTASVVVINYVNNCSEIQASLWATGCHSNQTTVNRDVWFNYYDY